MSQEKIYLQKRGKGGFYYLVIVDTNNGKRHFKKISCKTKNKNEALTFLRHYEKEKENVVINPKIKLSDIRNTVLDYVKSNLSNASLSKYELTLRTLINYFGDREMYSLSLKDIEHFKSSMNKRMKKESVNIYIRYIKAIWNLLVRLGYLKFNPLSNIKQFKTHEKEIISFTDIELDMIVKAIPDIQIKAIVVLAAETGLRISELLNLRLKNIDFENELIKLNNNSDFHTKSRKNRVIPFNRIIKDNLTECIEGTDKNDNTFIFRRSLNNPFKRNWITRYFRRILNKQNFDKRYHFHCLRATFIMRLVRKGVNPIFIQKLCGHSTLLVTQKYCYVQVTDLRKAINT